MTDQEYSALKAINWSSLKHLDVSPRAFQHNLQSPEKSTEARELGTALHCAILEPVVFAARYTVMPDFGDLRAVEGRTTKEEGKANKERRAEWLAAHQGATILDAADAERIAQMSASVRGHRAALAAIAGAKEQVVTWTDPTTDLACRGRLDAITDGVCDVKTAVDVSPRGFGLAAARYLYHGQLAFYHDGLIHSGRMDPRRLPLLVAVQNRAPWDVAVYNMQSEHVEAGRLLYQRLLRRLAECAAADWWPGVAPEITPLRLPEWAINAQKEQSESEDF
jgi:exodeoxyribonuclease VIII